VRIPGYCFATATIDVLSQRAERGARGKRPRAEAPTRYPDFAIPLIDKSPTHKTPLSLPQREGIQKERRSVYSTGVVVK
jgi:hypothetical protein